MWKSTYQSLPASAVVHTGIPEPQNPPEDAPAAVVHTGTSPGLPPSQINPALSPLKPGILAPICLSPGDLHPVVKEPPMYPNKPPQNGSFRNSFQVYDLYTCTAGQYTTVPPRSTLFSIVYCPAVHFLGILGGILKVNNGGKERAFSDDSGLCFIRSGADLLRYSGLWLFSWKSTPRGAICERWNSPDSLLNIHGD